MKLEQLLKGITSQEITGDRDKEIAGLAYDSRKIKPGYLFVAIRGNALNGHDYLEEAIRKGAVALVAEGFSPIGNNGVARISVANSRKALSRLSVAFYEQPYDGLNLVGITGTNGKTTTAHLLESILQAGGASPGVVGTINYRYSDRAYPAPVTTPESLDLMRIMREMADHNVTDVIMEVSSHALDQGRTENCPFRVAVFTNLSRDHLDYHGTMDEYFQAKSLLFRGLGKDRDATGTYAVINMDDPRGEDLVDLTDAEVMSYGLKDQCQVRAESFTADKSGIHASLSTPRGELTVRSPLIGEINIYNLLAAAAAALALDIDRGAIAQGIEQLKSVPGRLEMVQNSRGLSIVVDYSHTPDSLLKAVTVLRPLTEGRLITVFGCGGDRDKGKRLEMGDAAGRHSDIVIITSDNPRTEEPLSILAQAEEGVKGTGQRKREWSPQMRQMESGYFLEVDRRKAIRMAVAMAEQKDMVLIAGKGHEDYQIIGTEKRHFDDREEALRAVAALGADDGKMG